MLTLVKFLSDPGIPGVSGGVWGIHDHAEQNSQKTLTSPAERTHIPRHAIAIFISKFKRITKYSKSFLMLGRLILDRASEVGQAKKFKQFPLFQKQK